MAIESIGQTASTSSTSQSSLGQEDFLKILTTQLNYQDPLKPMDNQQFMAQMAQFASLEQTRAMNDNIETLLTIQSATQSVGLLGRTVEISTDSGTSVGTVTSLRFNNGQPLLTVKTAAGQSLTDLSLSKVVIVR
jgi:flagellar basal-body rod modification protein FlgD